MDELGADGETEIFIAAPTVGGGGGTANPTLWKAEPTLMKGTQRSKNNQNKESFELL